ncbi:hypothetical protein [Persephonella sp.]
MNIKKLEIREYLEEELNALNILRSIILFGKNSSTYKFALCHTLLLQEPKETLKYEDIRDFFLEELLRHYKNNPKQFLRGETGLTRAFDEYLKSSKNQLDWDKLVGIAEKYIYENVFDAFHNIGGGTIDKKFIFFEHDKHNKRLILTDNLNSILENTKLKQFILIENQMRWSIVEEAWFSGLSPNMLVYNQEKNIFVSVTKNRRTTLRNAVSILIPYQHGKCFYCNRKIDRNSSNNHDNFPDVDHFFPRSILIREINFGNIDKSINPDGIWNLVISCKKCNRGDGGKFDQIPSKVFFNKLLKRNIWFIEEHRHSLRNSILISLNASSKKEVKKKMISIFKKFEFISGWRPKEQFF